MSIHCLCFIIVSLGVVNCMKAPVVEMRTCEHLFPKLHDQLQNSATAEEIYDLTATISQTVPNGHIYCYQFVLINHLYASIIRRYYHYCKSQPKLVQLVQLIMDGNIKLNISLHSSTWNEFFKYYYKLKSTHHQTLIFQLLCWMQYPGSNAKPTLTTFNIILSGISDKIGMQNNIENADKLSEIIIKTAITIYKINPSSETYKLQFGIFMQTNNIDGMTKLLLDYANIKFADVDIHVLNKIINNLPDYADDFGDLLVFLMNEIVFQYDHFNMDTYWILLRLCDTYSDVQAFVEHIEQPNPLHDKVVRIIIRLRMLNRGYNTEGYENYNARVPDELKGTKSEWPETPNPCLVHTRREWDTIIKKWRFTLHNFDS